MPLYTGLYVYQTEKVGEFYYAVTTCKNGVENTHDISDVNSLKTPVEEVVNPGEPILYRCLDQTTRNVKWETQFLCLLGGTTICKYSS